MVSREDLDRFLQGHRTADALLREQTLRRLSSLTVEEARAEYDSLCAVWAMSRGTRDEATLDRWAIADRVAFRRRLAGVR